MEPTLFACRARIFLILDTIRCSVLRLGTCTFTCCNLKISTSMLKWYKNWSENAHRGGNSKLHTKKSRVHIEILSQRCLWNQRRSIAFSMRPPHQSHKTWKNHRQKNPGEWWLLDPPRPEVLATIARTVSTASPLRRCSRPISCQQKLFQQQDTKTKIIIFKSFKRHAPIVTEVRTAISLDFFSS